MTDKRKLGILGKDGTLLYSAHLWIFTDLVLFDEEMEAGRYFVDLPALRWTYDFIILPHMFEKYGEGEDVVLEHQRQQCGCGSGIDDGGVVEEVNDGHQQATIAATSKTCTASSSITTATPSSCCLQRIEEQHQNLRIHNWGSWHILKRAMGGMIQWQEFDDPDLATYLSRNVVMFKTSTDGGTLQTSQLSYDELMSLQSTYGRLYQMATKGTGLNATLEGARPFGYGAPPTRSFELDKDDDHDEEECCGCFCCCFSEDDNII